MVRITVRKHPPPKDTLSLGSRFCFKNHSADQCLQPQLRTGDQGTALLRERPDSTMHRKWVQKKLRRNRFHCPYTHHRTNPASTIRGHISDTHEANRCNPPERSVRRHGVPYPFPSAMSATMIQHAWQSAISTFSLRGAPLLPALAGLFGSCILENAANPGVMSQRFSSILNRRLPFKCGCHSHTNIRVVQKCYLWLLSGLSAILLSTVTAMRMAVGLYARCQGRSNVLGWPFRWEKFGCGSTKGVYRHPSGSFKLPSCVRATPHDREKWATANRRQEARWGSPAKNISSHGVIVTLPPV